MCSACSQLQTLQQYYIQCSVANTGVEDGCCKKGVIVVRRELRMLLEYIGQIAAILFLIITPFVWRKSMGKLENAGWVVAIIAALVSILPYPLQDLRLRWGIFIAALLAILFLAVGRRPFAIITNKIAKKPSDIHGIVVDPIRHYSTRDELRFHLMLSIAHDSVEILASTFTIVTEQYHDELVYVLAKGISFTFLLLDPQSKETRKQRGLYHRSEDLRYQIRNSLKVLCDLKCEFPNNVVIKLYDARAPRSIAIIDRENPDSAWIRVERRELDSVPNSRPSDAWYRREEEGRFDNFLKEYDAVVGKSKDYKCPSTS
jgi:hypothetical protein